MIPARGRLAFPPMRFTLLCALMGAVSYSPESLSEACQQLNPSTAPTTHFYESNPTYSDPTLNVSDWRTGTPESQGMDSAPLVQGAKRLAKLPQPFSLLVIRNNVLVFERYFNDSQRTDANNIHSASKTLLSGLVGIAIQHGFLTGVDEELVDILSPKFSLKGKRKRITIENLLHMNAGFAWTEDDTEYDIEKTVNWVQSLLDLPLRQKEFNYNTGLTHLLSAVLTESSGLDTCAFAEKYLLGPMGISVKHWGIDPQGYYSGGYNVYLTARDLAKLGQMYLNGGTWKGTSLIPQEWIIESTHNGIKSDHPQYTYGYLWWLLSSEEHSIYKMWGYGGQFVYLVPDFNLVFVTTADTTAEFTELDGDDFLVRYILSAIKL
jgi:CubicO group peptidase (beta-lactamase class C family)